MSFTQIIEHKEILDVLIIILQASNKIMTGNTT